MKIFRCPTRKKPGQALVEFALVIPLFMLLLCGVVDLGFIYHEYLQLHHAAREGGRLACVGAEYSEVSARVASALGSGWDGRTVSTVLVQTDLGGYDEVRVTVASTLLPVTPLAGLVPGLADGIAAQTSAAFRKE